MLFRFTSIRIPSTSKPRPSSIPHHRMGLPAPSSPPTALLSCSQRTSFATQLATYTIMKSVPARSLGSSHSAADEHRAQMTRPVVSASSTGSSAQEVSRRTSWVSKTICIRATSFEGLLTKWKYQNVMNTTRTWKSKSRESMKAPI